MSAERYPEATWLPLPEADKQGSFTKTQLIYHSTGTKAGARANRNYFAGTKVAVESTFVVDYDGEVVQIMPARARADANGSANRRAISVEVVGLGSEPYTAAQVEACIGIARWACAEHPIARRQIPTESASGIGWHVMFGAPGPWTSVAGKVCPGDQRIEQVKTLIIPGARLLRPAVLLAKTEPPPPPVPTRGPAMLIVFDAAMHGQYVCTDRTARRINGEEAEVYRAGGVPVVGEEVSAATRTLFLAGLEAVKP